MLLMKIFLSLEICSLSGKLKFKSVNEQSDSKMGVRLQLMYDANGLKLGFDCICMETIKENHQILFKSNLVFSDWEINITEIVKIKTLTNVLKQCKKGCNQIFNIIY